MNHPLRVSGVAAGISLLTVFGTLIASAGAQVAPRCARPNVPTTVIHAVLPDTPAIAVQQGITGTVEVAVSLDASSRVIGARILRSPSALLDSAALTSARQSTYQTEIRDCFPMATVTMFSVEFDSGPSGDRRPIAVVSATGVASRLPDVAYVKAGIMSNDDVASVAAAKNDAVYAALRSNVKALGVDDAAIRNAYFTVSFEPRPAPAPSGATQRYGYVATREVAVTVTDVTKAGSVVNAMLVAGVTSVSDVLYVLEDRRAAYDEALAAALRDAAGQAQAVAAASRMHVAGIKQMQVGQELLGQPTPAPSRRRSRCAQA